MEPESEPVKKIPGAVAGQKRTGSTTLQDPNLVSGCKLLELGRSVSTLQWANGITETCINLHVPSSPWGRESCREWRPPGEPSRRSALCHPSDSCRLKQAPSFRRQTKVDFNWVNNCQGGVGERWLIMWIMLQHANFVDPTRSRFGAQKLRQKDKDIGTTGNDDFLYEGWCSSTSFWCESWFMINCTDRYHQEI